MTIRIQGDKINGKTINEMYAQPEVARLEKYFAGKLDTELPRMEFTPSRNGNGRLTLPDEVYEGGDPSTASVRAAASSAAQLVALVALRHAGVSMDCLTYRTIRRGRNGGWQPQQDIWVNATPYAGQGQQGQGQSTDQRLESLVEQACEVGLDVDAIVGQSLPAVAVGKLRAALRDHAQSQVEELAADEAEDEAGGESSSDIPF